MERMTSPNLALLLAVVLLGCDSSQDTLGRSYAECLLKNVKQPESIDAQVAADACQRRFEKAAAVYSSLDSSGGMTPNADGTASFEFRLANTRADTIVTGFTVTVTFHEGDASSPKIAEHNWSFRSHVPPMGQLLEYGVLDAKAVAALRERHANAKDGADPLATAVYAYHAKIDAQMAVQPAPETSPPLR